MTGQNSEGKLTDFEPIRLRKMNKETLHAYAELSGDKNPIHLDREQALLAGHSDIICHGMLSMTDIGGWLTRAMEGWQLVDIACRFVAPMAIGTRLKVAGVCIEQLQSGGVPRASVDFTAEDAGGVIRVTGRADFQWTSAVTP
ncbi:MaoC/PaaZ C-terminal domain-containing protein [Halomonas sp. AOP13-D3-9]|uniref:MaoC/PaaZ C-terminal domain-containing protein n=1 Tax=Halomonas sp. AOP42-B2-16 TaxID=3457673 RepID=UPI004033758D